MGDSALAIAMEEAAFVLEYDFFNSPFWSIDEASWYIDMNLLGYAIDLLLCISF